MKQFRISDFRSQVDKGFTLVETLVVMLILVTIGSIILSIFVTALTGASKARNQQLVRENGNYAIGQMSRFIQFAKAFNYVDETYNPVGPGIEAVADCSLAAQDIQYKAVSITTFSGTETIFACTDVVANGQTVQTIASPSASVTGANASLINLSKVKMTDCYFTCTQTSSLTPPTIGIHFDLSSKNGSAAPVLFKTSVVPRNQ